MAIVRPKRGEAFNGRRVTLNEGNGPFSPTLYSLETLDTLTVGASDRLYVTHALAYAQTAVYASISHDDANRVSAATIVTATDDAGGDSIVIAGDYALLFRSGRSATVANSTANDGTYTTTGATYDATTNQTTIEFAAGTLSDGTDDGDITANLTHFNQFIFLEMRGANYHTLAFGEEGIPLPVGHTLSFSPGGNSQAEMIVRGYIIRG